MFLRVKGLVVAEADETQASFRLGLRFLKADGIWGLPPWNLKPSGQGFMKVVQGAFPSVSPLSCALPNLAWGTLVAQRRPVLPR